MKPPLTENTGGKPLKQWLAELAERERLDEDMRASEDVQAGKEEQPDYSHLDPGVRSYSAANYLPPAMRESKGWAEIGQALTSLQLQRAEVQTNLRLLHRVTPDSGEAQLKHLASTLGHPYESALSPYAATMLALPGQLGRWREVTGTDDWWRFVSYFLGADMQVTTLYSNDYKRFYPKPLGQLVVHGGSWYRTTHVNLVVNFRQLRFSLQPRSNQTLYDRVLELIWQYIPVTLRVHDLALMEPLPVDGEGLVLYSQVFRAGGARTLTPLQRSSLWGE